MCVNLLTRWWQPTMKQNYRTKLGLGYEDAEFNYCQQQTYTFTMSDAVIIKTRKFKRNPLLARKQVCTGKCAKSWFGCVEGHVRWGCRREWHCRGVWIYNMLNSAIHRMHRSTVDRSTPMLFSFWFDAVRNFVLTKPDAFCPIWLL